MKRFIYEVEFSDEFQRMIITGMLRSANYPNYTTEMLIKRWLAFGLARDASKPIDEAETFINSPLLVRVERK